MRPLQLMRKRIYILTGVLAMMVAYSSCEKIKPTCAVPLQALVKANFYQIDTNGNEYPVALPNAYIGAQGNDSLYVNGAALQNVALPLSPNTDAVNFFIKTDSTAVTDTLRFSYDKELKFISNTCGYTYFFTLKSASTGGATIDSVKIIRAAVNNSTNDQNIKIYFH